MVAVARQGRERDCRRAIRTLGFACYQPIESMVVVKRGRKEHTERPLLGPYIFVTPSPSLDWSEIALLKECECVLLGAGTDRPALVPDAAVEYFRAIEDRYGLISGFDRTQFLPDSLVRVTEGAFAGFLGRYVMPSKSGDVAEIDIFGRSSRVEFSLGALEAA